MRVQMWMFIWANDSLLSAHAVDLTLSASQDLYWINYNKVKTWNKQKLPNKNAKDLLWKQTIQFRINSEIADITYFKSEIKSDSYWSKSLARNWTSSNFDMHRKKKHYKYKSAYVKTFTTIKSKICFCYLHMSF